MYHALAGRYFCPKIPIKFAEGKRDKINEWLTGFVCLFVVVLRRAQAGCAMSHLQDQGSAPPGMAVK